MVTGASGLLGRAIVGALARQDEVRATVRRAEASDEVRALGAKVAVRPVSEPDDLIEILSRVQTLVHLVGGVNQPDDDEILLAIHASTLAAVAAAGEAGVRRFVLLSVPGADPDHPHPFLRAKGLAEEVVLHSGLEHAVLRCAHAYGLGGLWFTSTVVAAEHGFVVGDGRQRLAPVFADDVGDAVAAIDDRRDRVEGIWTLEGPDVLTGDEVFGVLGEGDRPEHVSAADAAVRLTHLLDRPVSVAATELFAAGTPPPPTDGSAPAASDAFDIPLTRFEDGVRITADRAARVG
jgi:uncharacterized protein YbjT (DUF2867 family)